MIKFINSELFILRGFCLCYIEAAFNCTGGPTQCNKLDGVSVSICFSFSYWFSMFHRILLGMCLNVVCFFHQVTQF